MYILVGGYVKKEEKRKRKKGKNNNIKNQWNSSVTQTLKASCEPVWPSDKGVKPVLNWANVC